MLLNATLPEAFGWCRERNPTAADGFRAEVFQAIDNTAEDPLRRRADENGDRRNVLKHFPYSVVYDGHRQDCHSSRRGTSPAAPELLASRQALSLELVSYHRLNSGFYRLLRAARTGRAAERKMKNEHRARSTGRTLVICKSGEPNER